MNSPYVRMLAGGRGVPQDTMYVKPDGQIVVPRKNAPLHWNSSDVKPIYNAGELGDHLIEQHKAQTSSWSPGIMGATAIALLAATAVLPFLGPLEAAVGVGILEEASFVLEEVVVSMI